MACQGPLSQWEGGDRLAAPASHLLVPPRGQGFRSPWAVPPPKACEATWDAGTPVAQRRRRRPPSSLIWGTRGCAQAWTGFRTRRWAAGGHDARFLATRLPVARVVMRVLRCPPTAIQLVNPGNESESWAVLSVGTIAPEDNRLSELAPRGRVLGAVGVGPSGSFVEVASVPPPPSARHSRA